MKKSKKIALSGIFTSLCVVVLFFGSIFQSLDLSSAAFGSIIILIAFIELGKGWALGVYAASSVLALVLLPNKTAAVVFAFFAGFYPVFKVTLNKIKPAWLSYLARGMVFNAILTFLLFAATFLIETESKVFEFAFLVYLASNVTFFVFDFALERIAVTYVNRLKPLIFRKR